LATSEASLDGNLSTHLEQRDAWIGLCHSSVGQWFATRHSEAIPLNSITARLWRPLRRPLAILIFVPVAMFDHANPMRRSMPLRASRRSGAAVPPAAISALPAAGPGAPVLDLNPRAFAPKLLTFEAVFVLFFFAGTYKADPRLQALAVDLTGLFFALSVSTGFFIVVRRRMPADGIAVVMLGACFVAWCALTFLWTPGRVYATEKLHYVVTLTFWCLVAGALVVGDERERLQRFFTLVTLFSAWVSTEAFIAYLTKTGPSYAPLVVLGSPDYLNWGRVLAMAAPLAFVDFLYRKESGPASLLSLGLFLFFMAMLLVAGGRGPFFVTLAVLAPPLLIRCRDQGAGFSLRRFHRKRLWLLLLLSAGVVALAISGHAPTLERADILLTSAAGGTSAAARWADYAEAVRLWYGAPLFGHGIGSWPVIVLGADVRDYPHNIMLEILVELGVVGAFFFLALLAAALKGLFGSVTRGGPIEMSVAVSLASALINAMISGDLPDNRPVFFMIGLAALAAKRRCDSHE
jgi:O-antigen ligase